MIGDSNAGPHCRRARLVVAVMVLVALLGACAVTGDDSPQDAAPPAAEDPDDGATGDDSFTGNTSVAAEYEQPAGAPFVEGTLDHLEYVERCAADAGASVRVLSADPPGLAWDGNGRTSRVVEQCMEVLRDHDWIIPSPFDGGEDGNRLRYQLWIQVHECLQEHGYPTAEPPSEDAFAEQGPDLWNPYQAMGGAPLTLADPDSGPAPGQSEQLRAQELCGASAEKLYQEQLQEEGD